jgi:hypothetical protein
VLPGGVGRGGGGAGFGVLTLDVDVGRTGDVRRMLVGAVVCAVDLAAVGVGADEGASIVAAEPAPQPARRRQASTPVVLVALVVLLRVMARSVHLVVWSGGLAGLKSAMAVPSAVASGSCVTNLRT